MSENNDYIKMDYDLMTPQERVAKVQEIIDHTPQEKLTPRYLEKLADYITEPITKEEKKQKYILTKNQMVTINKRETSFEGLAGKLENGEDGIYNMMINDKNVLFQPKSPITQQDIDDIPELRSLVDAIKVVKEEFSKARGMKAYKLKKQIIEMSKDQYEIRKAYQKPVYCTNLIKTASKLDLSENIIVDEEKFEVHSDGLINLFNPQHVSALLCNYAELKASTWDKINSDMRWLLLDFEKLIEIAFENQNPMYYDIMVYKIDGLSNEDIQNKLYNDYGTIYAETYISKLWRKKIPEIIVEAATDQYLSYYFLEKKKGKYKKCNRCGQIKLAHNRYFSKNSASKDGLYSICKCCRNKKKDVSK